MRELIANKVEAGASAVERIAIVFGCEESGLSNEQLEACDLLTGIPLAVSYPSLNLSQAVMLYAYELGQLHLAVTNGEHTGAIPVSQSAQWLALKGKLESLLPALSF